jgi:flavin reductase (DIM6/NTAB) family NADH-FMN oxidoreductase RutF
LFFDFGRLAALDGYKILVNTIVPRPIAWVVTLDLEGRVNCAPFSFFNCFADDPPTLAIGVRGRKPGTLNDTGTNIRQTGQFVVNLVDEALLPAMNVTAVEFAHGVDEIDAAGLSTVASLTVRPPRIAGAPVSFECERLISVDLGPTQTVIFGKVLGAHVRDEAVIDAGRCYIDAPSLGLVSRAYGAKFYARISDIIEMPRLPNP